MASEKIDLYKLHEHEYITPKEPKFVKTRPAKYLAIIGKGEPGGETFIQKIQALYNVAYTIKMAKKSSGHDYVVCKLEALWWGSKGQGDFSSEPQNQWNWKLMIRIPDFIKGEEITRAIHSLLQKGKMEAVKEVQIETMREGLCVQMLHVGPYRNERETMGKMTEFAKANGLSFHGIHHEIYLSDPRRVPEDRLKTILRMPVK